MTSSATKPTTVFLINVLIFQQFLGGLTFPFAKYGLEQIEPFTFAFYRFLISGIVLLTITHFSKKSIRIPRSDGLKIFGLGVLIVPFNQVMYLYGQSLTGAGHGSLLFATTPVWIFIAAIIHLKERPGARRAIGIAVALAGVALIMTTGAVEISMDYLVGDMIILVAVLAWTYYTIYGKPLVEKYGALRVTAYALASGSAVYFPFGLYKAILFDYSSATTEAWLTVLYVALGTSVAAYVLWYWVIKYLQASRVAVFHNLQPLFAAGIAAVWLGEDIGLSFILGGLVVLGGVVMAEI